MDFVDILFGNGAIGFGIVIAVVGVGFLVYMLRWKKKRASARGTSKTDNIVE